eukprot:gene1380-35392_t
MAVVPAGVRGWAWGGERGTRAAAGPPSRWAVLGRDPPHAASVDDALDAYVAAMHLQRAEGGLWAARHTT